jgi:hypothetical protein
MQEKGEAKIHLNDQRLKMYTRVRRFSLTAVCFIFMVLLRMKFETSPNAGKNSQHFSMSRPKNKLNQPIHYLLDNCRRHRQFFKHGPGFAGVVFRFLAKQCDIDCRPRHMPTSKFPVLLPEQRKTLLVVSTCNEIAYTLRMLTTLERSSDDFDVVFVDDHSEDDTVSVLRKRGYAVIEKDAPLGLTDSWNKGYELFVTGGYDFLLVANNDILVPSGSISKMQDLMRHYPFMAPSTTLSGAGHNPAQSLANICNLKSDLEGAIDEPRNYQRIQNMADIMCNTGAAFETPHTSKFGELLS